MSKTSENPVDSLRMPDKELAVFLAGLDRNASAMSPNNKREHSRYAYDVRRIELTLHNQGGSEQVCLVKPRNISRGGVNIITGSFIYPGTPCGLELVTTHGERMSVVGKVMRCRHVGGLLHEVGIKFNKTIDIKAFVAELNDAPEDDSAASRLSGHVLCIDDSECDRALIQFVLRSAGATVTAVGSAAEALSRIKQTDFDLIVTDIVLPNMTGLEFAETLRKRGNVVPIIAISAKTGDANRAEAIAKGCTDLVEKPYDGKALINRLVPFLTGGGGGAVQSTLWSNASLQPLIIAFLEQLERHVRRAGAMIQEHDTEALTQLCMELKGTAGSYGFPQIAEAAALLSGKLAESNEAALQSAYDGLAGVCSAARRFIKQVPGNT